MKSETELTFYDNKEGERVGYLDGNKICIGRNIEETNRNVVEKIKSILTKEEYNAVRQSMVQTIITPA